MNRIEEKAFTCPYCGENVSVLVDGSIAEQQYVEDCQVCCRPMSLTIRVEDEWITLIAAQEND